MFSTREKNDTSNQNREKCFFACEKSDTSNQNSQMSVSCAPKFLPFIGACSFQRPRFASSTSQTFNGKKIFLKSFSRKKVKKKKLENWSGIVSCISLSMKRIVESRLNNSERGKTERGLS